MEKKNVKVIQLKKTYGALSVSIFMKHFNLDEKRLNNEMVLSTVGIMNTTNYYIRLVVRIIKSFLKEPAPVNNIETEFKNCMQYYYCFCTRTQRTKFRAAIEKLADIFLQQSFKEFLEGEEKP